MSTYIYRRMIPLGIIIFVGVLCAVNTFINWAPTSTAAAEVTVWGVILTSFTMIAGTVDSFIRHGKTIQKRVKGRWIFSLVTLATILIMAGIGIPQTDSSDSYQFLYTNIFLASDSSIQAIGFFWAAASMLRVFRARSIDATILLGFGLLGLLVNAPVTGVLVPILPTVGTWWLNFAQTGANRAIIMGGAVGAVAVGIRTFVGAEKGALPEEAGGE